jgi:8-oxo-dGTP diphosphatase
VPALAADPACALHLYGKAEVKPGRKMGHVNRLRAPVRRRQHHHPAQTVRAMVGQPVPQEDAAHGMRHEMHTLRPAACHGGQDRDRRKLRDGGTGRRVALVYHPVALGLQRLFHQDQGKIRPRQPVQQDDTLLRPRGQDRGGQDGNGKDETAHVPNLGQRPRLREATLAPFPDVRSICAMSKAPASGKTRPRLAVRGILLIEDRLLLVNAYSGQRSDLLCAPGGGVEPHASLPENLRREFHEETGLTVEVGAPCMVNEFHAPARGFHQVDIYFRVTLLAGDPLAPWTDPEGVVNRRVLASRAEMAHLRYKPDTLPGAAWGDAVIYDPLEPLVR